MTTWRVTMARNIAQGLRSLVEHLSLFHFIDILFQSDEAGVFDMRVMVMIAIHRYTFRGSKRRALCQTTPSRRHQSSVVGLGSPVTRRTCDQKRHCEVREQRLETHRQRVDLFPTTSYAEDFVAVPLSKLGTEGILLEHSGIHVGSKDKGICVPAHHSLTEFKRVIRPAAPVVPSIVSTSDVAEGSLAGGRLAALHQ